MSNEPVAWMYERPNGSAKLSFVKEKMLWEDMTETPLYTHPVKELALTDEEMISIYEKDWSGIKCGLGRAVEQAILRKAQEK